MATPMPSLRTRSPKTKAESAPEGGGSVLPMTDETYIPGGFVHALPGDLQVALPLDPGARATWEAISLMARNEWICWIRSAKKPETRRKRVDWGCSNLRDGSAVGVVGRDVLIAGTH
jgi:hypothetical protein